MESDIRHLDKRVKIVWEFPTLVTLAIFWLIGSVAYAAFSQENAIFGMSHALFPVFFLVALAALIALPVYLWVGLIYENFTIELASKDIIIREGVITRRTTVIPYGRIQDIRTERTLIERMLGLATLEIETAGSSKVASQTMIPGIAKKNELIAELMELVEKAKGGAGLGEEMRQGAPSSASPAVLSEILVELKTISSRMESLITLTERQSGGKTAPKGRSNEKGGKKEPKESASAGQMRRQGATPPESEFEEYSKFRKR